jgi:hypothetical protein
MAVVVPTTPLSSTKENIFKKSANEHFTVENILKWRNGILEKIETDQTYVNKLTSDNNIQIQVEAKWIESSESASARLPFFERIHEGRRLSKLIYAYPEKDFLSTKIYLNECLSSSSSVPLSNFFEITFYKFPISPELVHEINCKLNSLNKLKLHVPNFQYLFGYGKTCNTNELFLLHEKRPAQETVTTAVLHVLPHENTLQDFYNVFLQLIFALKKTAEQVNFTHYNLSPDSVFCSAGALIITDLAFAHVKCQNNANRDISFGGGLSSDPKQNMLKCIYRDRANEMTDIYRFLILSYKIRKAFLERHNISMSSDEIIMCCTELLKYFNSTDTIEYIIEKTEDSIGFNFPITHFTRVFSMGDFIAYLKRRIPPKLKRTLAVLHSNSSVASTFPMIAAPSCRELEMFYDNYALFSSSPEEDDKTCLHDLLTAFIKGFSTESSKFSGAIKSLKEETGKFKADVAVAGEKTQSSSVVILDYINVLRKYQTILLRFRIVIMIINLYWGGREEKQQHPDTASVKKRAAGSSSRKTTTVAVVVPTKVAAIRSELSSTLQDIYSLITKIETTKIRPLLTRKQLLASQITTLQYTELFV